MITFVIPLFNKSGTIARALQSVMGQPSSLATEIIVIDDGSTDESSAIALSVGAEDKRFRLIHQPNTGVSAARNAGIRLAKNPYIALLDADDELCESYSFEMQRLIRDCPHAIAYCCNHRWILRNRLERSPPSRPSEIGRYIDLRDYRKSKCELVNSSKVIIKKSHFETVGGFPEDAALGEDQFFWLMLFRLGRFAFLDKRLVNIYVAPDQSRAGRVNKIPFLITYFKKNPHDLSQEERRTVRYIYIINSLGCLVQSQGTAFRILLTEGRSLYPYTYLLLSLASYVPASFWRSLQNWRRRELEVI